MTLWHAEDTSAVLERLESQESGLFSEEARTRLDKFGFNEIREKKRTTAWMILFKQFKNFLILLLLAAGLVSLGIGIWENSIQEILEAGLIVLIVVFIVIVGFYQEYHAEEELSALKKMLTPEAVVIRDGEKQRLPAREIVPGDIIHIEAGDRISTDARLIGAVELRVDESVLTGEAEPVEKGVDTLSSELPIADRTNMVFMGTTVTGGKGVAVAAETGMGTQFGRIAEQIQEIEEKRTPLQEKLDSLGRYIGLGVVVLCLIMFLVGAVFQDNPLLEMFLIAVALAVAAVPEGLPGVVTVALAVGTRRMVKRHAIVRTMPAVETLGCTTVICTDKTGTITHNQMTVQRVYTGGRLYKVEGEGYAPEGDFLLDDRSIEATDDPDLNLLLTSVAQCNNAGLYKKDGEWKTSGDPTEIGLLTAAAKAGLSVHELAEQFPRIDEIPFSSERKRMATVHRNDGSYQIYVKGAPDVVLKLCTQVNTDRGPADLDDAGRQDILQMNETLGREAFRVLAVAYRTSEERPDHDRIEEDLIWLGLLAIKDPPRDEVREAIRKCRAAGIRTVMITGDHQVTAEAVGREVGLADGAPVVVNGIELNRMSDEELDRRVDSINIFARVSPEHKLRIVNALQNQGHVVAMTGDGVNDAPALRQADIGVAMGITGTDVSKEAADMVLTDDNFASIVGAVEEGRGIYDNIKKFFAYMISGNVVEVVIVFLTSILGSVPVALTATQILIINLVSDGLPALALGVDPFEPGAMKRPPRRRDEPLHQGLAHFLFHYPVIVSVVALGLFFWIYDPTLGNGIQAQTVAFLTVALSETFQSFAARSTRYSLFKVGLFANRWLWLAAIGSFIVCVGLVYIPLPVPFGSGSIQDAIHLTPLSFPLFLLVFLASVSGFIYLEIRKAVVGRVSTF